MNVLFRIAIIAIVLFNSFLPVVSQNNIVQNVRGLITDNQTTQPIQFATVIIQLGDKQKHAITDENGEFIFDNIPVGKWSVMAYIIGYISFSMDNVWVNSGKETYLNISLEQKIYQVEDVVINAVINKEEPVNQMALAGARMLSSEEANRYAGSWGDPARMVSNLAGVVAANDTRNDIIIRGNSPIGLLWTLDGFEIPNPNHFGSMGGTGGPVNIINNNQLTNSDFYTGAFPAQFGNATSGVFDLRLRNGNSKKQEFLFSTGFNGFEVGGEGYLTKKSNASYMINARYLFLEFISTLGMDFGTGFAIPEYQTGFMPMGGCKVYF